jgi:molecular chaperone GrpE
MFGRKKEKKKMNTNENDTLHDQKKEDVPGNEQNVVNGEDNKTPEANDKNAELEAKLAEINDKYLRLYSEFDNFKKRTIRERVELIRSAGEDVFKLVLPLLDDFERALKANEAATDVKAVNEGVNLVYQKMKTSLTSRGLEEMKCIGEEFNPDLHEAITNIPAPSEDLKGKVVEVVEKGYLLNGKVIRYAKVIVGN